MNGVLLVNMGGPNSLKEMRSFLARMFMDPHILPYSKPVRLLLSLIISIARYRKSWKKYKLIGGTPIIKATHTIVQALQDKLGEDHKVRMAFSYSPPLIKKAMHTFEKEGIYNITVIPLYPQSSHSTTSSVKSDMKEISVSHKKLHIKTIREFYKEEEFVNFWSELITKHVKNKNYKHPFLLFSAHSIPKYMERKGDTYPWAIRESSNLIAKKAGLEYDYAFQSRMHGEWLEPDTKDKIGDLVMKGKKEIVIVPISFVSENLETLYDLDREIIPWANNNSGIQSISRVEIPEANESFIKLLVNLVRTYSF